MTDTTHHCFLEDYDVLALPRETMWEPQWDDPSDFDSSASPTIPDDPLPHTLDGRYARMVLDKEEVSLFDTRVSFTVFNTHASEHEAELCGVLGNTFECLGYQTKTDTRTSEQLILELQDHTNYAVEQVVRVMNKAQYSMHKALAQTYNVHTTRRTYHGTTFTSSTAITNTGFKSAACERALYGKGVYSSTDPWVALGFATPFQHTRQVFFVVEYLQGPSAPGYQDQVDFGLDSQGQEVLTLTNPDESILCASRENQLLATHRITVRYMSERPFTQKIKDCLQVVHSHIGTIITTWGQSPAAPAAGAKPAAGSNTGGSQGPKKEVDATHDTYQVGDRVIVTGTLKSYADLALQQGVIKRIVQGRNYFFCVLLDCPEHRLVVKDLNSMHVNRVRFPFLKADESELLCLKVGHIEKDIAHKNTANGGSVLGKRRSDGA
jgi:hypothetical protein